MPVGAVPFPFGKCRICKDRATGIHYGVATCEGCKGFFKRSITKAEKYKCFFGGECDVTPKNRNRCKSCRFRHCLESGMSVEAVRMGRIPKIEKEKALEAVLSTDMTDDPYIPITENLDNYPRYSGPSASPYNNPTGPEIYDFDTGCISRQNRTVADDNGKLLSDIVTTPTLQGQRSLGETVPPMSVAHGNNMVKSEFSKMEAPSCHYSQSGNEGSAMEIHECSKDFDIAAFERKHNTTYQYSDMSSMDVNNSIERNPLFDKNEQLKRHETLGINDTYHSHAPNRTEASTYTQGHVHHMAQSQKSNSKSHRNPNHFSLVDTGPSFGDSSQFYPNEPGFYSQGRKISGNHDNLTMTPNVTLTSQSSSGCSPTAHWNDDTHLHHGFERQNRNTNIPVLKTEPLDMEVSDNFCDTRQGERVSGNHTHLQNNLSEFPENIPNQAMNLSNSQLTTDRKLMLPVEFPRPNSDRAASILSFPPTCPTPSSVDGSTTSSQRGRFSPGLIKVLLEQVLDSTQDHDVAIRLKQRLEQNKMDKSVVTNVLNLIREVSAKRNKHGGSEETSILSPVETSSETSSALSESKMENIQRFLEDVSKFSRPQPVGSPPYRPNISHHTSRTYDRQNSSSQGGPNSLLHLQDLFEDEGRVKFTLSEHQNVTSVLDELGLCKLDTDERQTEKEAALAQNNQSSKIYPFPVVTLTQCEQSRKVESSQAEITQNSSEMPCDLIGQSINENEVTCSDDKLSKEDVKKQIIQMTLEGLSVASKILFRLKPEHREKFRLWKLGLLKMRVMTDSEEDVEECYKKIIDGIPQLNELILGFCEQVPGFLSINSEDRGVLMKRAYYDIWMLNNAEYFFDNEVNIILQSGEIYAKKPMEKILNKEIVSTLMDFSDQFNKLHLSDLEVTILCAISLTCSDDLEVKDRTTIKKLHSLMLDVLAIEIERNHPDNHTRLLIDIFRLMPLLAVTNKLQCQIIAKYRLDKPEQVEDENKAVMT